MKIHGYARGFTLYETILSIALLHIILISWMYGMSHINRQIAHTRNRMAWVAALSQEVHQGRMIAMSKGIPAISMQRDEQAHVMFVPVHEGGVHEDSYIMCFPIGHEVEGDI